MRAISGASRCTPSGRVVFRFLCFLAIAERQIEIIPSIMAARRLRGADNTRGEYLFSPSDCACAPRSVRPGRFEVSHSTYHVEISSVVKRNDPTENHVEPRFYIIVSFKR